MNCAYTGGMQRGRASGACKMCAVIPRRAARQETALFYRVAEPDKKQVKPCKFASRFAGTITDSFGETGDVGFRGQSGHLQSETLCLLLTRSRHRVCMRKRIAPDTFLISLEGASWQRATGLFLQM